MIKIGISGFCGKMGQRIFALAKADKELKVVLGLEAAGLAQVGTTIDGVKVSADVGGLKSCDCFIDFTAPGATITHLEFLVASKKPAVIGTTGLDDEQCALIARASRKIPIVFSPNMSVGVNLLFRLAKTAAGILKNYRVRIEEAHHVHKKDAPSGTAKKIAQIISEQGVTVRGEDIKAIREGDIVGDHRIIFESGVDRFELFHSAKTRDIFAQGALMAAKWVYKKKAGLYSMDDVLALKIKN
ncbi:MAG: 4-hydroxy-tetrahydrodipicolinate reductase [Candidatus Omnitrophota bacterium]